MPRSFLAVTVLLLASTAASAQPPKGKSGFGGGFKAGPPVRPAVLDVLPPTFPDRAPPITLSSGGGFSGGFGWPGHPHHHRHPGYPFYGVWPGFGGWAPFYGYTVPVPVGVPVPVYIPVGPADPVVELSGEAPAVLVLQFPAEAEVWVSGKKGSGEPQVEWTLTSPPIQTGSDYTFDVKARWKAGGKTYEYSRVVTVAAGNRSRSLVFLGTEVKE
jgi:uncharacterized protein (TIGR03000 family)